MENVLDILRSGIDSGLRGLGISSTDQITPEHLIIPTNFHCALAVDGAVVKTAQGPKGALCSIRAW